jgi:murein DD-endopeptidase MepM/ murein hydrolase activator NlpD
MMRIQRSEEIVRGAFEEETTRIMQNGLGQGGMPVAAPSFVVSEDFSVGSSIAPPVQSEYPSMLERARALQASLEGLVKIIHERRQLLNSTPSILPVEAQDCRITSGFGWRRSPFTGLKEFHDGLDISAPSGTPIVAPGEGRVCQVGHDSERGKYLQIDHGKRCITTYAHLSRFNVELGQEVKRGETIAYMGNTGRSTGPHLHYEIEIKGKAVNPKQYIFNSGVN